jgi:hypothetical protein
VDIIEIDGRSRAAFDAHLPFFGTGLDAWIFALDQKGRELLAADFREDGVQISSAAVGDPHLLAIEDVVFAVRTQIGAGLGGQGVGAGLRFAEAIGRDHLGACELGEIALLLLFSSKKQQGQRTDTGVSAMPGGIGAVSGDAFGDDHGGSEIHLHAAEFLRQDHARETQLTGFAEDGDGQAGILVLDRVDVRRNLFVPEFLGGARDGAMLFGEILGRKDLFGSGRCKEK